MGNAEQSCLQAQQALAKGDFEDAKKHFKQAILERPDSPEAHYGLGVIYFRSANWNKAEQHFLEVTTLQPRKASAYINLGAVYTKLEQFDRAMEVLRKGIQIDSKCVEGYYNLGRVYKQNGKMELAIDAYRQALRLQPDMFDAHQQLGQLYLAIDQAHQAIMHFEEALKFRPNWEKAQKCLEEAEAKLKGSQRDIFSETDDQPEEEVQVDLPAVDPERTLNAEEHGLLLGNLHRATVDSHNAGQELFDIIHNELAPSLKHLSSSLASPETRTHQLQKYLDDIEAATDHMVEVRDTLADNMERVQEEGEKLLRS